MASPHSQTPSLLQASAGRERHGGGKREFWGRERCLSLGSREEERKRKQILRQPCLLCFPYRSLIWVSSPFLLSTPQVQVTSTAWLAGSPSLFPCPPTPFWSACHLRVRGIFQKEIQVMRLPCLKSYRSIPHHRSGGDCNSQLWSGVAVCGRHCWCTPHPLGWDAVTIPSC